MQLTNRRSVQKRSPDTHASFECVGIPLNGGTPTRPADHMEALDEASSGGSLGSAPAINKDKENKKGRSPSDPAEDKFSMKSSQSSPGLPPSSSFEFSGQRVAAQATDAEAQRVPPAAIFADQDRQILIASVSPAVLAKLAMRMVDMFRHAQGREGYRPPHTFVVVEEIECVLQRRGHDRISKL